MFSSHLPWQVGCVRHFSCKKFIDIERYSASNLILSQVIPISFQTCYVTLSVFSHLSPRITCGLSFFRPLVHIPQSVQTLCPVHTHCQLTFTPRVEEDDDVLAGLVSSCGLALQRASCDREAIQANHCIGRRVD